MASIVFPYMDLPESAQKEVLRTMDHKDLFAFSTLCRKSRTLVASLNIPAVHLDVDVCDSLIIEMKFPENTYSNLVFNLAKPNLRLLPLDEKYVLISNGSTTTWRYPGINFQELIIHLCLIFNFSELSKLMFSSRDEIIRVKEVWDTLSGVLDYLHVYPANSDEFTQKILRICLATSKKLILNRVTPLLGPNRFRHVAIQNLDALHLELFPTDLTLDDLLCCNSSIIGAVRNQHTQKTINRFLRSWIKGSNRRLEYISFSLARGEAPDVNTLFKQITYQVIPDTVERKVKKHVSEYIVMANIAFPYMDLPKNAQKEILRTMDHKDLFAFSTLSRKSKGLVASLNIPALHLSVDVWEDRLKINMMFPENTYLKLVFNLAKPNLRLLPLDGRHMLFSNGSYTTWRDPRINSRELITHLCSIFNFSAPSKLVLCSRVEINRVEEVWDTLSDLLDYLFVTENSESFVQKILNVLLPTLKKLILYRATPLMGPIRFRHVAIQNLDALYLEHPIDLNDLLLCNSSIIGAIYNQIAQKTFNRFFRSWIKGSNRRLEYISFSLAVGEAADVNTLFKGIAYQVTPDSVERRVKKHVYENMSAAWRRNLVTGGFEIRNKWGISATILLRRIRNLYKNSKACQIPEHQGCRKYHGRAIGRVDISFTELKLSSSQHINSQHTNLANIPAAARIQ